MLRSTCLFPSFWTAAEVIYTRADAEKEFMGLTTFAGNQPTLREAVIAKNYLNEKDSKICL